MLSADLGGEGGMLRFSATPDAHGFASVIRIVSLNGRRTQIFVSVDGGDEKEWSAPAFGALTLDAAALGIAADAELFVRPTAPVRMLHLRRGAGEWRTAPINAR